MKKVENQLETLQLELNDLKKLFKLLKDKKQEKLKIITNRIKYDINKSFSKVYIEINKLEAEIDNLVKNIHIT